MLGLDGCPGGWAGVLVSDTEALWRRYDGWGDGLRAALAEPVDLVAIDIPIGLPAPGTARACDVLARKLLGPRRSSVFSAPPRALLSAADHRAANALARELTGRGISIQAFGIYGRIAAVDTVVTPATQTRLVEIHPELAFRELAGDVGTKHDAAGLNRRETALRQALPPFDLTERPPRVRRDDALDALACAWSARRWLAGTAVLVPGDPPRDERGLFQGIAG